MYSLNMHMCKIIKCTDLNARGAYDSLRDWVGPTKSGPPGIRMQRNLDAIFTTADDFLMRGMVPVGKENDHKYLDWPASEAQP